MFDVVVLSGLKIIVAHFHNWWFGKVWQIGLYQVYTQEPCFHKKNGSINAEASQSVIFLLSNSVPDCICCDDLSLVSAVSSISASVSALLLPALCLMCAPCIMTVVDYSCYGRSDSTRRPSLATLCKHRPGQGGSGVVWWVGGLGLDGLDCGDDGNECFGFFSFFCKLSCCGCLRNQWEWLSCFATIHRTDMPHQLLCLENPVLVCCCFFFLPKTINSYVLKWTWFEMNTKVILLLTSALRKSLETTNMHVQGVSWILSNNGGILT